MIFTQFYPYFLTFCRYFAYFSTFTPIILNWKIYNRAKGYWNDKDFLKKLPPMEKSVPDNFVQSIRNIFLLTGKNCVHEAAVSTIYKNLKRLCALGLKPKQVYRGRGQSKTLFLPLRLPKWCSTLQASSLHIVSCIFLLTTNVY